MKASLFALAFLIAMSFVSGDRPYRLIPIRISANNGKATADNPNDPRPSGRFFVETLAAIKAALIGGGIGGFIGGQLANSNGTFPSFGGGDSSSGTPTCIITRRRRSLRDYDDDDDNQNNKNYKFTYIADTDADLRQLATSISPPGYPAPATAGTGATTNCIIVSKGRSAGDRIMRKRTKFLPRKHTSGTNRFRGKQAKPRF